MEKSNSIPVLILAFNRSEKIQALLHALRSIQPKKIYISLDGPRAGNAQDELEQQKIIEQVQAIDWQCTLKIHKNNTNLGCKKAVASGITWFFSKEEKGIILEDDCIPSQDFFQFCAELLAKYATNPKVMSIAGSCLIKGLQQKESYFFSSTPLCWGWATWRRAWNLYDVEMKDWPEYHSLSLLDKKFSDQKVVQYWTNIFDKTFQGKIDTWDYQWVFTLLKHQGVSINPSVNLITNTGFDNSATHTKFAPLGQAFASRKKLNFPLIHPKEISVNTSLDKSIQDQIYLTSKFRYLWSLLLGTLKHRVLRDLKLKYFS